MAYTPVPFVAQASLPTPLAGKGKYFQLTDYNKGLVFSDGTQWESLDFYQCNVRNFGALGDGVTNDRQAFVDAMASGLGSIVIPPGTYLISTDLTITAGIDLKPVKGALFSIPTTKTLTILGTLPPVRQQLFTGAGSVIINSNIVAFPEWWGVDGTADDVQINAALAAASFVSLSGKDYSITGSVSLSTNNTLCGQGSGVTSISWGGGTVGNEVAKVRVVNCDNASLVGLSIDGNSSAGSIATGSGLLIDDGSTNTTIDDVICADMYRHGLILNTGSNINISRVKINGGCNSSAVIIGQFPASYGLSVNQACENIDLDGIIIENVLSDGFGIWNCSGGDGYTSKCQRINTSNLIVKKWGLTSLGYAYWGSGITTYAEDVNLNNFCFDNLDAGNDNIGRGLHIEIGNNWNHNNGTIHNLTTGTADPKLGYGITFGGGTNFTYSNITMKVCGIGVLCNGGSGAWFNNVIVNDASYSGFYVGGTNLHFSDCYSHSTGSITSTDYSWLIFAESPLTIDNVTFDNCYGYVASPNAPSTAYPFLISATAFSNLRINNFKTDGTIAINYGSQQGKLHGNTFSVALPSSVAAGTDYEVPIAIAATQGNQRICILNAFITFSSSIASDVNNYNTYKLYNRTSGGAGVALTSAGLLTKTTDFTTAFNPQPFPINVVAPTHINAGDILTLAKTHTGTGQAETNGILTIEYTSY